MEDIIKIVIGGWRKEIKELKKEEELGKRGKSKRFHRQGEESPRRPEL